MTRRACLPGPSFPDITREMGAFCSHDYSFTYQDNPRRVQCRQCRCSIRPNNNSPYVVRLCGLGKYDGAWLCLPCLRQKMLRGSS